MMRNYIVLAALLVLVLATTLSGCGPISAESEKSGVIAGSSFVSGISQGRAAKVFAKWNPARPSTVKCQSRNAKLILHEDGTREWEAELMTTNSRDLWDQTFHFYDTERPDQTWFGSRAGGHFEIAYGNVWTYWRSGRGSPDPKLAQVYDRIGYVVWVARC